MGPNKLDARKDDSPGGVFVERCRFLEETNCKVGLATSGDAGADGVMLLVLRHCWNIAASVTTFAAIPFLGEVWARDLHPLLSAAQSPPAPRMGTLGAAVNAP